MVPDTVLTVLAIAGLVLGVVLVLLIIVTAVHGLLRALHLRVSRVGSTLTIESSLAANVQLGGDGDPTRIVEELLKAGRRDDAIIVYRMQQGVSLAEAEAAIEALERNAT